MWRLRSAPAACILAKKVWRWRKPSGLLGATTNGKISLLVFPVILSKRRKPRRAAAIPVLAIGGITLANAAECLAAGTSGIAGIRLFQDARDMSSLVQSLRELKS